MYFYIFIIVLVGAIVLESFTKKKLSSGQVSDEVLSSAEKTLVWIFCILDPFIAGAIFYYGWKKRLPVKAKTANRISWIAFGIFVVLYLGGRQLGIV